MRLTRLVFAVCAVLCVSVSARAQTPSTLTFTASPDHGLIAQGVPVVASYELVLTPQGGSPLAPLGLAKPAPAVPSNTIALNVTTYLNSVPAGTYTAVVRAVGPGGSTGSAASDPFSLAVPAPAAPGTKPVITR